MLVLAAGLMGAVVAIDRGFIAGTHSACFCAFVALCCSRARRWTWVVVVGSAAIAASGAIALTLFIGILAITVVIASESERSEATVGALLGGLSGVGISVGEAPSSPALAALVGIAILCAAISAYGATSHRGAVLRLGFAVIAAAAVAVGCYAIAARSAWSGIETGTAHARLGFDKARANDAAGATDELALAAQRLSAAHRALGRPWAKPIRLVPVFGTNARGADRSIGAVASLASVSAGAANQLDLDSIEIVGGQIDLDLARRVHVAAADVLAELDRARARLADSRSPWLVGPLDRRVREALTTIDDVRPSLDNVREAARIAPKVLGEGTTKRYLVLFTTPVEARAAGGFPGNFAELRVDDGRIAMSRFGRVSQELQTQGVPLAQRVISGPEEYLARYNRFGVAQTWQNITMSPDFPSVARVAAELYPQSGGTAVDGVIAIDPSALAALLDLTGPVRVNGIDEPIGAQNAVEFLQLRQYVEFGVAQRVDVLESVALATFERLTSGVLPGAKRATQALAPTVRKGHLRFAAFDPDVSAVLARAGIDGAVEPVRGDDLAVVVNNAGGNKIDAFLLRSTDYDVVWNPATGEVHATLQVVLTNNAPASGLPDYIIGNALSQFTQGAPPPPRGTNRLWLSIYTPFWPENASLNSKATGVQIERELGRWVASLVVDIAPGQSTTFAIEWRGQIGADGTYALHVAHQPQATLEQLRVRVRAAGASEVLSTNIGVAEGSSVTRSGAFDEPLVLEVSQA